VKRQRVMTTMECHACPVLVQRHVIHGDKCLVALPRRRRRFGRDGCANLDRAAVPRGQAGADDGKLNTDRTGQRVLLIDD
jgi:hypothetical protein